VHGHASNLTMRRGLYRGGWKMSAIERNGGGAASASSTGMVRTWGIKPARAGSGPYGIAGVPSALSCHHGNVARAGCRRVRGRCNADLCADRLCGDRWHHVRQALV